MAVRIALQCEGSDAMIILSEDNLAAERLRHAGQGIYNDASGRVEGNQPFQVAYLSKDVQRRRLLAVPAGHPFQDPSNVSLGKCVVFEGHRPATWDAQVLETALSGAPTRDSTSITAVLGDSVSIEPAVCVALSRQAGRNVLVVGTEDRPGAACLGSIAATLMRSSIQRLGKPLHLVCLDGSRPDDEYSAAIPGFLRSLDESAQVADPRGAAALVQQLHEQLKNRMAEPEASLAPILLVLVQLGRFRDLRKSDEFGFGSEESSQSPDAQLQEILRDGPSVGIHSLVWSDNVNTLSRWLSRQAMHDLELRVLMQMSANDSNHLIDSAIANRLDANVMLVFDEASGQARKFRPYALFDPAQVTQWATR
jgi:hypothetical protein